MSDNRRFEGHVNLQYKVIPPINSIISTLIRPVSSRTQHYRTMKANRAQRRALQRLITEAEAKCPFNIDQQPNVNIHDASTFPAAPNNSSDGFIDVDKYVFRDSGRSLVGDLAAFSVRWKLSRLGCNDLFALLQRHGLNGVPTDCRSAIKSIRSRVDVVPMGACGSYYHFGLAKEVGRSVGLLKDSQHSIKLQFNIDGLPIWKSSQCAFWPILCRAIVGDSCTHVFPVGLYCGSSKPVSVDDYLAQFIRDLSSTLQNGIYINGQHRDVEIHSFVCDAPARQYVKKVKGHTGFSACERCCVNGERPKVEVKHTCVDNCEICRDAKREQSVKFVETGCAPRCDELFRLGRYEDHQRPNDPSTLLELPIDIIKDFPLDYMHLVLLGVVKRLLKLWLGTSDFKVTKFSINFRLMAAATQKTISARTTVCHDSVTSEFQRRPRQMDDSKFFKAKEFRTLLCYTFPFVFEGMFNNVKVYEHFLLLVVVFRVMLGKNPTPQNVAYVRALLLCFVEQLKELYGRTHMTYSVHGLLHVADDYERFGVLDNISAFPFENYMMTLKSYVRRPGKELQQAVKRRHEESLLDICHEDHASGIKLKKERVGGPLGQFAEVNVDVEYGEVQFEGKRYTAMGRDCFVSVNGKYGRIENFVRVKSKLFTLVRFFLTYRDFFHYPCPSTRVGIAKCESFSDELEAVNLGDVVKCVGFRMEGRNSYYVAKLLHETLTNVRFVS